MTQDVVLSDLAFKCWIWLTERPGQLTIEEAKREFGASKSAIERALNELEELGLIQTTTEETT